MSRIFYAVYMIIAEDGMTDERVEEVIIQNMQIEGLDYDLQSLDYDSEESR